MTNNDEMDISEISRMLLADIGPEAVDGEPVAGVKLSDSSMPQLSSPATADRLLITDYSALKSCYITMANLGTAILTGCGTAPDYTVTNGTTDRTFDADSTSTAELADILATLIADLQSLGVLQ